MNIQTPLRTLPTLALAVAFTTAAPLHAQIQGQIVDAERGEGIPAATVTLINEAGDTLNTVVATSEGEFFLGWTSGPGMYALQVGALGYVGTTTRMVKYEGEPMLVHVTVRPAAVELQALEVSVERRSLWLDRSGFYHRRRTGQGNYLVVDDDIRSTISNSIQLLREIPGVSIYQGREPYFRRAQLGARETCFPMIVVNNIPMRREQPVSRISADAFDMLVPRPILIEAIEVYRSTSTAPPGWAMGITNNNCGVIGVWTVR